MVLGAIVVVGAVGPTGLAVVGGNGCVAAGPPTTAEGAVVCGAIVVVLVELDVVVDVVLVVLVEVVVVEVEVVVVGIGSSPH